MGACFSRNAGRGSQQNSADIDVGQNAVTFGHNRPLRSAKIKWTTSSPMTEKQLKLKLQEFWDTAPAYEGRREIWDALRAASQTDDLQLAQAIIDSANVTLPTGTLTSAYDELGNHYVLPEYCISPPTNLVKTASSDDEESQHSQDKHVDDVVDLDETLKYLIKVRLSTGDEEKLNVHNSETILQAKRRLKEIIDVEARYQRWFFYGRKLDDKMTVKEANLSEGYVVQVIVDSSQQPSPVL